MLVLFIQTGHLVEEPHGAPVEGVESLGDPVTVLLTGALPPVVVEAHSLQSRLEPVQLGQLVVVERHGHQPGQPRKHGGAEPAELVVVEVELLQGLQAGQLLRLNTLQSVVAQVERSQS